MLMPKKDRIAIYEYLIKEGVIVASEITKNNKHPAIGVSNLHVVQLMRSFTSKEYCRHTYNWRYNYYYLTDEGMEYLREYLHLPAEFVPNTLKSGPAAERAERRAPQGGDRAERGDRAPRRGGFGAGKKEAGPGANWNAQFAGAGRGKAQQ